MGYEFVHWLPLVNMLLGVGLDRSILLAELMKELVMYE